MFKKTILTLTFILTINFAHAQLYIGANAGIHNTKLYNKSDAQADARQDYVFTIKPQFGLNIGYKFSNKFSIELQPQLYTLGQQYKGAPNDSFNILTMDASLNLQYAKLPLYLKYSINKPESKLSTFIAGGANLAYLLNYTETVAYYSNPNSFNIFRSLNKGTFNNLDGEFEQITTKDGVSTTTNQKVKTDKRMYNKLALGFNLSFGMQYAITPKLSMYGAIIGDFGITNVENKDTIKLIDAATGAIENEFTTSNYLSHKYNASPRLGDKLRVTNTTNRAIGLQLGVIYILGNRESYMPKKM